MEYAIAEDMAGGRLVVDGRGDVVVAGSFKGGKLRFTGGQTLSSPNPDATLFLARWSSTGALKKAVAVPATLFFDVGLAPDNEGGLYVGGSFKGTAVFDGTTVLNRSAPYPDGFVWYVPPGPK